MEIPLRTCQSLILDRSTRDRGKSLTLMWGGPYGELCCLT
jgi:hypothetical protein